MPGARPPASAESLALVLLDDLVGDGLGDLGVRVELHRVHGPARGLRAQVADVAEHLGQRHQGTHDLDAGGVLHRLDLAATGVQVADDVAHVLLGSTHLDAHERLEDGGVGLADGLLEAHRAGDLERHLRRVDIVARAVDEDRLDTHHGVAGKHADVHGVLETGIDQLLEQRESIVGQSLGIQPH